MKGLQYDLSIPKYVLAKAYHTINRGKFPAIFPNLNYKTDLPKPKLNNENWVILKSLLSGICGSDQNMLMGHESFSMEPYASFPCVMGHENISEVIECGKDVKNISIGDKVIVNPAMGCAVHDRKPCSQCAVGKDALCENFGDDSGLGAGMSLGYHKATGGGWSEFYQAHQSQIYKVDSSVPLKRAVLADPMAAILQPIAEYAKGKNEKRKVFIYGAGTVGLLGVAAIRALKLPWEIVVGYRYEFQGKLAKELGADTIINTGGDFLGKMATELGAKLRKVSIGKPVLEGGGFDAIFDCVGSSLTVDYSLRICKTGGEVIMVATGYNIDGADITPVWFREVSLKGTCMSRTVVDPRDGEMKSSYQIIADALIELPEIEKMVTHEFSLSEFKSGLRKSMDKKNGPVVKVVFNPGL